MTTDISLLCAVSSHVKIIQRIRFASADEDYRVFDLISDVQKFHDRRCNCTAVIEGVWKVEFKFSENLGKQLAQFSPDEYSEMRVDDLDLVSTHFPFQPAKEVVSIVCGTVVSLSPTSSSSISSGLGGDIDIDVKARDFMLQPVKDSDNLGMVCDSALPSPPHGIATHATTPSSPISSTSSSSAGLKRSWFEDSEDESSSDSEFDQKRARTQSLSSSSDFDNRARLPWHSFNFFTARVPFRVAFVDKTRFILQLPGRYNLLLLRPPRFGKTALLTTLCHYYDVHEAGRFLKHFGPLAVVTANPETSDHSQYLCLSFHWSNPYLLLDAAELATVLRGRIALVLQLFVIKYAKELQVADSDEFVQSHRDDLFGAVFDLVKMSGYRLFVGVDDYDAPARNRFFAPLHYPRMHESFASQGELDRLMDTFFWAPLRAGSDVIDKLFVTGTFFMESPALQNLQMLNLTVCSSLQTCCGFTDQEALEFARSTTEEPPTVAEIRRSCGEYVFQSGDATEGLVEPAIHTQQLITRLSGDDKPFPFEFVSSLCKLLPESSDDDGTVTTDGLINLLATGEVKIHGKMAPLNEDTTAVTWSSLYYLGALTHDRKLAGTFRVASSTVLSLIHSRIDRILADRHNLPVELFCSIRGYSFGDPSPFIETLSEVLRDQVRRSLGKGCEPDLRGVFELVMGNTCCTKAIRTRLVDGIELFSLNGITHVRLDDPVDNVVRVWELRTLTLLGMWQGANANARDDKPSRDALQKLHQELTDDDEESLLDRLYSTWSSTKNTMETVPVRSFIEPQPDSPLFLAVGGARILIRR
ncbi:hypothetical protein B0H10DRAFT_2218491 [Mycena sp. CBHHK59/15]|nr:hypothetical protein B0H10DRAFT_2218491 [Mycena sp. CBHHK59/15]